MPPSPRTLTHLLITNWLPFSLQVRCRTQQPHEWLSPYRPDLNISRTLDPYSSVNELQLVKELNSVYMMGNFGYFTCQIESSRYGRALVPGCQVNARGVQAYDLNYGMYTVRHRTGLKFNIYEIKGRDQPDNSRWMQRLLTVRPNIRVNELTMPGSHDSGMIINRFSFLKRLVENQYEDILGQLKAGIRYFDLRMTIKNGQYVSYHGGNMVAGIGVTLQSVIVDVNAFLEHYGQNQTVFLVVSKTRREMKPQQRFEMIVKLEKQLKNAVLMTDIEAPLLVYEKLANLRGKVVLVYDGKDFIGYQEPILKFNGSKHIEQVTKTSKDCLSVYDSYSNTNKIQDMIQDQNNKLQKYGGYGKSYLFLYSFTLTVQSQLRLSLQHYSIELLGNISRSRLPIQLQKMRTGQMKKPNIIYYDFIDAWSCSAIIALNE